jgi:hypothetical protein
MTNIATLSLTDQNLYNALLEISAFPENHSQAMWLRRTDCGTTLCLAGTICALGGYVFKSSNYWFAGSMETGTLIDPDDSEGGLSVSEVAEALCGLDTDQGFKLFFVMESDAGLGRVHMLLWDKAEEITDGRVSYPGAAVVDAYRAAGSRLEVRIA